MYVKNVAFEDTGFFSSFFLDYIHQKKTLDGFYNRFPSSSEAYISQIKDKQASFSNHHRSLLCRVLAEQYEGIDSPVGVGENIEALSRSNTFTVTTGHQLNIFTGPLYVIYKIMTTIGICNRLREDYPKYNFVPIYWMASEDHDFDEIARCRIQGTTYTWQTNQQGAVGRFDMKDLIPLLEKIPGQLPLFEKAYKKQDTLSKAVRSYMNDLFGCHGLIVIDADCRKLKQNLQPVMEQDFFHQTLQKKIVHTNHSLIKSGYQPKAYVRDINFFFLKDNIRERFEKQGDRYVVKKAGLEWSEKQMLSLMHDTPECFSPNVIARPLYQEIILPNLSYVGGPTELTYWMQLGNLFSHFKIPLPMLTPRTFALIMDKPTARKFAKTEIKEEDIFHDKDELYKRWITMHDGEHLSLDWALKKASSLYRQVSDEVLQIDSTLQRMTDAAQKKMCKDIVKIEQKMLKAKKRKHEYALRQIADVKAKLFPEGKLQERSDNFLDFYLEDKNFIDNLLTVLPPFDYRFHLLFYPLTRNL